MMDTINEKSEENNLFQHPPTSVRNTVPKNWRKCAEIYHNEQEERIIFNCLACPTDAVAFAADVDVLRYTAYDALEFLTHLSRHFQRNGITGNGESCIDLISDGEMEDEMPLYIDSGCEIDLTKERDLRESLILTKTARFENLPVSMDDIVVDTNRRVMPKNSDRVLVEELQYNDDEIEECLGTIIPKDDSINYAHKDNAIDLNSKSANQLFDTQYECPKCKCFFQYHMDYQKHMEHHVQENKFSQSLLTKMLNMNNNQMQAPITILTPESSPVSTNTTQSISHECYKCDWCSKTLYNAKALELHNRLHKPKTRKENLLSKKKFICFICERVYAHKHTLQNHMKAVHTREQMLGTLHPISSNLSTETSAKTKNKDHKTVSRVNVRQAESTHHNFMPKKNDDIATKQIPRLIEKPTQTLDSGNIKVTDVGSTSTSLRGNSMQISDLTICNAAFTQMNDSGLRIVDSISILPSFHRLTEPSDLGVSPKVLNLPNMTTAPNTGESKLHHTVKSPKISFSNSLFPLSIQSKGLIPNITRSVVSHQNIVETSSERILSGSVNNYNALFSPTFVEQPSPVLQPPNSYKNNSQVHYQAEVNILAQSQIARSSLVLNKPTVQPATTSALLLQQGSNTLSPGSGNTNFECNHRIPVHTTSYLIPQQKLNLVSNTMETLMPNDYSQAAYQTTRNNTPSMDILKPSYFSNVRPLTTAYVPRYTHSITQTLGNKPVSHSNDIQSYYNCCHSTSIDHMELGTFVSEVQNNQHSSMFSKCLSSYNCNQYS